MFDKLIDFVLQLLDRFMPVYIVKQYQGGAFFRSGKFRNVKGPGLHWKIPLLDDVDLYDVVTTTLTLPAQSVTTKDGIGVVAKAVVRYHIADLATYSVGVVDQVDALSDTTCGIILSAIEERTWEEGRACDLDGIVSKKARADVKKWGVHIDAVTFTDLSQTRSIRLFNESSANT